MYIRDLSLKDKSLYMYIMENISTVCHTTMLEFLATLNETTLDGVFTARLTPSKFENPLHENDQITTMTQEWLQLLTTPDMDYVHGHHGDESPGHDPNILKILCFREYGDKVGIHFHIRFVTTYKTRKSIADHIKYAFPIPKGTGKGNEAYSVRDCKAKDKTIWKNASYIAKGRDCVFHFGYTAQEVEWFCTHAAKYQKMEGKLKWEQILLWNEPHIRASLKNHTFTDAIIDSVLAWHKAKNKEIPMDHTFRKIVHNISFKLNPKYREGMLNGIRNDYRRKNKDLGYHMTMIPPTEELEDWFNTN